jgi:hypothetical protein
MFGPRKIWQPCLKPHTLAYVDGNEWRY